jgi:dihydrofolate reductase
MGSPTNRLPNQKLAKTMPRVVLYIATSIDGFIARPDGSLDWLESLPNPDQTDHGYGAFLASIGTIVMGRATYQEIVGFGVDWPYPGIDTYVVTRDPNLAISTPGTQVLATDLAQWVAHRKQSPSKDIWLVGGGQLVSHFLDLGLIDAMTLTIIPTILGRGIPLFPNTPKETDWALVKAEPFSSGAVNLVYEQKA